MGLEALYQELILDHNRSPRNYGELADATRRANGHNPSCGDTLTVWVKLDGDVIADVSFTGSGCAISKASASLMTQAVKGKSSGEADALFEKVHGLLTGRRTAGNDGPALGRLEALAGVSRFPTRVKCATLAWHALRSALHDSATNVTTESGSDVPPTCPA
jgi:nitrogen fixation protein NifU and related proteins